MSLSQRRCVSALASTLLSEMPSLLNADSELPAACQASPETGMRPPLLKITTTLAGLARAVGVARDELGQLPVGGRLALGRRADHRLHPIRASWHRQIRECILDAAADGFHLRALGDSDHDAEAILRQQPKPVA